MHTDMQENIYYSDKLQRKFGIPLNQMACDNVHSQHVMLSFSYKTIFVTIILYRPLISYHKYYKYYKYF